MYGLYAPYLAARLRASAAYKHKVVQIRQFPLCVLCGSLGGANLSRVENSGIFLGPKNPNAQMATILPPPSKKQKTADSKRAQEQQEIDTIPDNLGSVRIQFHDAATGTAAGPPVSVPVADATTKNIELILNTLLGNVNLLQLQPGELRADRKVGRIRAITLSIRATAGQ